MKLVVSLHDVAVPTLDQATRWADLLAPLDVPLTVLVVPGPWRGSRLGDGGDAERRLVAWLRTRQEQGDEMSVHGWYHRADVPGRFARRAVGSVVARGAAELWALDRAAAAERTAAGLAALDRCRLTVTGTTPPGWLCGSAARAGLADAGLAYVTDHTGLTDLATRRRWRAPALCHRPGSTLEGLGRGVVAAAPALTRLGLPVRIGLHPDDLDRPGLGEATVEAIRGCLAAGARATTYRGVLEGLRAS